MRPPFVPMKPEDLHALGVLDETDVSESPLPSYAIWHIPCFAHGDAPAKAIRQMGFAEVCLAPSAAGLRLTARQRLLYEDGGRFRGACDFDFAAECHRDTLCSLQRWSLTMRFASRDGSTPFPAWTEGGTSDAGVVTIERDGQVVSRASSLPWSADLGLLAVAGGLPPASSHDSAILNMDGTLMEKQTVQAADTDEEPDVFSGAGVLRRVARWGHGCSPWNYWVNAAGRTVMAACNSTVYLVDALAGERCRRQMEDTVYGSFTRRRS